MSKITKATLKSFIRKNKENLFIMNKSSFSGMSDMVESNDKASFRKAELVEESNIRNSLGVVGLWLVGSSRDYFKPYDDGKFKGIEIYNCCGSAIIATN